MLQSWCRHAHTSTTVALVPSNPRQRYLLCIAGLQAHSSAHILDLTVIYYKTSSGVASAQHSPHQLQELSSSA